MLNDLHGGTRVGTLLFLWGCKHVNHLCSNVFFKNVFFSQCVAKVANFHRKMKKKWGSSLVIFSQIWL
jgi:hypothetical protein